MERVPTETDLIRLCDAADRFCDYYQEVVTVSRGSVQQIDERLAEIERWTAYGDRERTAIMAELPQRLEAMNVRQTPSPAISDRRG